MSIAADRTDPGPSDRILELDAVRGLAAVAVLCSHLPRGFWFGETGVDLFFVLSGYLITGIILRHRGRPGFLRGFYARRALRIFPIYYLAIAVVVTLNSVRKTPESTEGLWYYLLYLQNVWEYWGGEGAKVGLSLGHTWTLAIEEQFYLIWPALVLVLPAKGGAVLCVLLSIAPVLLRLNGVDRLTLVGHTDGLAMGALLAFLGHHRPTAYRGRNAARFGVVALTAGVAYVSLCAYLSGQGQSGKELVKNSLGIFLLSVTYTGLIGAILCLSNSAILRPLRWRPLVWVGTVSYGLYLYHWILYELLDTVFKFRLGYRDPLWLDGIKVTLSFAAAAVSWYVIEKPIMRIKGLIAYGRPSGPVSEGDRPAPAAPPRFSLGQSPSYSRGRT